MQVAEGLGLHERVLAEDDLGILEEAASFRHDALRKRTTVFSSGMWEEQVMYI